MAGVLIVHNRYQQAGGEDTIVANEYALLELHGWEPRLWSVANDGHSGLQQDRGSDAGILLPLCPRRTQSRDRRVCAGGGSRA